MPRPPGTTPDLSPTSGRNQDDAAVAAWKARKAKRIHREVEEHFREQEAMPRKRKLSACDQRVGGPNWRVTT